MLLQCKYPCFSQTFIEKEANGNNVNVFNNTFFLLSYGFMGKEGVTFIRNDARLEKF